MSEIQKCPNLVRGGGGSTFFKNVPNSKMSQRSKGREREREAYYSDIMQTKIYQKTLCAQKFTGDIHFVSYCAYLFIFSICTHV